MVVSPVIPTICILLPTIVATVVSELVYDTWRPELAVAPGSKFWELTVIFVGNGLKVIVWSALVTVTLTEPVTVL